MKLEITKLENNFNILNNNEDFVVARYSFINRKIKELDWCLEKYKYLYFILGACYLHGNSCVYNYVCSDEKFKELKLFVKGLFEKIIVHKSNNKYMLSLCGLTNDAIELLFNIDDKNLANIIADFYINKNEKHKFLEEGIYEITSKDICNSIIDFDYLLGLETIDVSNLIDIDNDLIYYLLSKGKKLYLHVYEVKEKVIKTLYIK